MMLPLTASSLSNLWTSTSFLYAQSLAKTPLRDVLKARRKERMRAVGDSFLEGKIQIFVEAREEVEVACRKLVREEAAAWRGGRRCLFFCYSVYNFKVAFKT